MSIHSQPLVTGSLISVWHGSRGNLYVVAGANLGSKTLSLIKHNCINNDGSIHASTQEAAFRSGKFHLEIPYEELEIDESVDSDIKVVPKVNRVYGTRNINRKELASFVRHSVGSTTLRALKPEHGIYPGLNAEDHRAAVAF